MLPSAADVFRWHVAPYVLRWTLRPDGAAVSAEKVADTLLPAEWIHRDWVCYCGGVGEDIRFERHLADDLGANVWAFDPTPRAIRYMETADYDRGRLRFVPVGLWSSNATLRFNAPANPTHVSHSVTESLGGQTYFDAPCRSVTSLMGEYGHTRVDLLKLNIEGAEHEVMENVIGAGVRPKVITLTYEGRGALKRTYAWTNRLRRLGYRYLGRRGWFFTYVREA